MNKSQLRWQCRRGMLELDYLLESFLNDHFDGLNSTEQMQFKKLLGYQDRLILNWLLGKSSPQDKQLLPLIKKMKMD